jgi:hypothetical protein
MMCRYPSGPLSRPAPARRRIDAALSTYRRLQLYRARRRELATFYRREYPRPRWYPWVVDWVAIPAWWVVAIVTLWHAPYLAIVAACYIGAEWIAAARRRD